MATSLLPPNATALERAIEAATARISDAPVPLRTLWDPANCPESFLPWLGWALSVDRWDLDWTVEQKRAACRGAFVAHRIKGTRAAVDAVIDGFDLGLAITEWWERTPPGPPHTFSVTVPGGIDALAADLVDKIIREIAKAKPARAHFIFEVSLLATATAWLIGGARTFAHIRLECVADMEPV